MNTSSYSAATRVPARSNTGRGLNGVSILTFGVLVACILLGVYARVADLGRRPLNMDEFLFVRGVQYVLENGLPEFPRGGYYVRGLPLQYLNAAVVGFTHNSEAVHRIFPVVFSLCSVVLIYFYSRRFLPSMLALVAAALVAISSWEVEFGRFIRMYSLFQCLTIGFFIAYNKVLFGDPGWDRGIRLFVPHCLVGACVLLHELGIFLVPFLFVPVLFKVLGEKTPVNIGNGVVYTGVSGLVLVLSLGYLKFNFEKVGVDAAAFRSYMPPEGTVDMASGFTMPFWDRPVPYTPEILALVAGLAGVALLLFGALAGARLFGSGGREKTLVCGALLAALLAAAMHAFAITALIWGGLILRCGVRRVISLTPACRWICWLTGIIGAIWLVLWVIQPEWRVSVDAGDGVKAFRITFFGWPDLYLPFLNPLLDVTPLVTVWMGGGCAWLLIRHRHRNVVFLLGHPVSIVIYTIVAIGMVSMHMLTTRYGYFIYPFAILVMVMFVWDVARTVGRKLSITNRAVLRTCTAGACIVAFLIAEDGNIRHLLNPGSTAATYRIAEYERFGKHWFWTPDVRSPAQFLNQVAVGDAAVVIPRGVLAMSYYLNDDLKVGFYYSLNQATTYRHVVLGKDGQKTELFTGSPLLEDESDVKKCTASFGVVFYANFMRFDHLNARTVWPDEMFVHECVFVSEDGRIEVFKVVPRDLPIIASDLTLRDQQQLQ
jgi:hypothetical protein